jgi:hypothetical protein
MRNVKSIGAKLKADARNAVGMISADKAKTQTYCQILNRGRQMNEAISEKDQKRARALAQEIVQLGNQLPEFISAGLPRQCLRMKGIKPQFPNGVVNSVSFVSTTNTARSLAGFVVLALALTSWRSPGSSEKLCPAV